MPLYLWHCRWSVPVSMLVPAWHASATRKRKSRRHGHVGRCGLRRRSVTRRGVGDAGGRRELCMYACRTTKTENEHHHHVPRGREWCVTRRVQHACLANAVPVSGLSVCQSARGAHADNAQRKPSGMAIMQAGISDVCHHVSRSFLKLDVVQSCGADA